MRKTHNHDRNGRRAPGKVSEKYNTFLIFDIFKLLVKVYKV